MMILIQAIQGFIQLLIYLIIARAIMSWFVRNPYGPAYKIYMAINQITEPILQPCRRILSRFGMNGPIDFSPILAFIGLQVIGNILVKLLYIIF